MNSVYFAQFITVAVVHFLAVASPGPDFLIVTKNSLISGRKTGIFTSIGVALGISVHVLYCILGIGLLISQSIILFNIIKYIGAIYLIYIGYKALKSRKRDLNTLKQETTRPIEKKEIKNLTALKIGLLVNVLNPKTTLFFLALFTQVIDPSTPKPIQILYGIETIIATFIWFSVVTFAFANNYMQNKISKIEYWIDRASGAVLISLGIKIAITNKNN